MLFVKTFVEHLAVRRALKMAKNSEEVAEKIIQASKEREVCFQGGDGCQTVGVREPLQRGYGRYTTDAVAPGEWKPPVGFEHGGEADQFHGMLGQRKLMQAMDDSVILLRQEAIVDEKVQAELSEADKWFEDRIAREFPVCNTSRLTVVQPPAESPQEIDTTGPKQGPETSHEAYQLWGRKTVIGLRDSFSPQDQFCTLMEGAIRSAMGIEDNDFCTRIGKIQEAK